MALVTKNFSDIITFTRASTATFFNSSGVLTSAAINAPRFDYNPSTLAAQGLLIEEARTNSIRNNTMVGAVAGTPGTLPTNWGVSGFSGLTREIVGIGVFNGVTYVDIKYSGTSSGVFGDIYFEGSTVIAATNSQSWAESAWIQIVAGTQNGVSSINLGLLQYDSGGVALGAATLGSPSATISTTWQRVNRIGTTNNASIAFVRPQIAIGITSGAAIDITLRIGLPQLELGAFATSVIPTTTTALTRSADVASVNTLSPWFNAAAGTVYTEAVGVNNISGATRRFVEIGNGTIDERFIAGYSTTTNTRWLVQDGGVNQADVNVLTGPAGSLVKMAAAYAVNDFQQASNGTLGTADTSGTLPTVTAMYLGSDYSSAATNTINGYLRRITYYPRRLSNAELQALTT